MLRWFVCTLILFYFELTEVNRRPKVNKLVNPLGNSYHYVWWPFLFVVPFWCHQKRKYMRTYFVPIAASMSIVNKNIVNNLTIFTSVINIRFVYHSIYPIFVVFSPMIFSFAIRWNFFHLQALLYIYMMLVFFFLFCKWASFKWFLTQVLAMSQQQPSVNGTTSAAVKMKWRSREHRICNICVCVCERARHYFIFFFFVVFATVIIMCCWH